MINKSDVVLSDLSGAIFDAICLKKPVLMFYSEEIGKFGHYLTLPIQLVKDNYILGITKNTINTLKEKIEKTLSLEQINIQKTLFNKLFCCENNKTKDKFKEFLRDIENGALTENYYQIHQNLKDEFNNLYEKSNKVELLEKELSAIKEENQKNINDKNNILVELNNLKEEKRLIINSASWKITKPLRVIRRFFTKKS